MKLKTQLVLVAIISLLLPLAGITYVRETELALRANQRSLLMSAATSMAATIETSTELARRATGEAWYLPMLERAPTLDGYRNDWTDNQALRAVSAGDTATRYSAATYDRRIYLYVVAPTTATALVLTTTSDTNELRRFTIDLRQPGGQVATDTNGAVSLQAFVALTDQLRIEISLAASNLAKGAGFSLLGTEQQIASSFTTDQPPHPVTVLEDIQRQLLRFQQPGMRVRVVNIDRFVIADTGAGLMHQPLGETSSALSLLFRRILDAAGPSTSYAPIRQGRDNNALIAEALAGEPGSLWVKPQADADVASVVAAVPLAHGASRAGALVVQQLSNARLLLSSQALSRLAGFTLVATLGTALALLAYAAWLSLRIRKLARAADSAMSPKGKLSPELPSQRAGDEIGSLSRSFSGLLRRVGEYNDYLQALSGRLSHELNTPLSIVSSSLENLAAEPLAEEQRGYALRAQQGVERMRKLVRTMSEATRVEQAASEATRLNFDLGELLGNLVGAYQDNFAPQKFSLLLPDQAVIVCGSPTLLVQLLDKVIDNAVSYAATDTAIRLTLRGSAEECELAIANQGEPLAEHQQSRIFESMVSFRPDSGRSHMGFGLYIARLIAEAHAGALRAETMAEPQGTVILLTLPCVSDD